MGSWCVGMEGNDCFYYLNAVLNKAVISNSFATLADMFYRKHHCHRSVIHKNVKQQLTFLFVPNVS